MTESLRRNRVAAIPSEEQHFEQLLPGDLVYIALRADHEYRGHPGVFIGYIETDVDKTQLWARVAIAEVLVEVRADRLKFAPEPEASDGADAALESPVFEDFEHLRTWESNVFRLELYNTGTADRHGRACLAYEFFDEEFGQEPVFAGADFHCSPLDAVDSDETVAALLDFLSLRPGETDVEYFESYTPRQLEWCWSQGEKLGMLAYELENRERW